MLISPLILCCYMIPVTVARKEFWMHFGRSMRMPLTRYLSVCLIMLGSFHKTSGWTRSDVNSHLTYKYLMRHLQPIIKKASADMSWLWCNTYVNPCSSSYFWAIPHKITLSSELVSSLGIMCKDRRKKHPRLWILNKFDFLDPYRHIASFVDGATSLLRFSINIGILETNNLL